MTLNCGTIDHPDECLCDVVVDKPVEINPELFMGSVYSDYVLRAFGPSILENPDGILDYMEELAKAKDRVEELRPTLQRASGVTEESRAAILAWLRSGESIIDWPSHADMTWDDTMRNLTGNRPSVVWTWPEDRWLEVESTVLALGPEVTDYTLSQRLRIPRGVAISFRLWYFNITRKR